MSHDNGVGLKFFVCVLHYFKSQLALFPEKVHPIMSSRFMDTWNPSGIPGSFHEWMGVGVMVSCKVHDKQHINKKQ